MGRFSTAQFWGAIVGVMLLAVASSAFAQVTEQFKVSRDNSIMAWDGHDGFGDPPVFDKEIAANSEEFSNHGWRPEIRVKKFTQHQAIMDWDTDAINAWLAANTQPGDKVAFKLGMFPTQAPTEDVEFSTLESLNDWAEGDGGFDPATTFTNFNWSADTPASTQDFAQTYWKLDDEGDRVLDLDRSLPWVDDDTGTGGINDNQYSVTGRTGNFTAGDRIPNFSNFFKFTVDAIDTAVALGEAVVVDVNPALANAILTDPNNRGIAFGPPSGGSNESSNWTIFSREGSGNFIPDPNDPETLIAEALDPADFPGDFAAFLEIVVNGEGLITGDMDRDNDTDFDDIAPFVLGLNDPAQYLTDFGMPSSVNGDTDLDGDQDFDDIGGFVALLGAGGSSSVVPEPASLLLLASGLLMLVLGARRRS